MKSIITIGAQIVLALILLIFGSNKFLGFIPMEEPPIGSFMDALIQTGYMMPLIGLSEVIIGFLLLINKWKGLALVWLAPISINIILFHLAFDISTIGPGALVLILNIFLIYINWKKFKTLF